MSYEGWVTSARDGADTQKRSGRGERERKPEFIPTPKQEGWTHVLARDLCTMNSVQKQKREKEVMEGKE